MGAHVHPLSAAPAPPSAPIDLAGPDGRPRALGLDDLVAVARDRRAVRPLETEPSRYRPLEAEMARSAGWVQERVAAPGGGLAHPIYGINTGFGALAGRATFASPYLAQVLSWNLVTSHAAGLGPPLDEEVVRAAVLVRARQLAAGYSGIRIEVVNRLLALLGLGVYPRVPAFGSLGASGDLAPLAHLALLVCRPPEPGPDDPPLPVDRASGEAWLPVADPAAAGPRPHLTEDRATGEPRFWRAVDGAEALAPAGGQVVLEAKEGLALINGTSFSTALVGLALADAEQLLAHAELLAVMTLEALRGFRDALLAPVHAARGHAGAMAVAARMAAYTAGSTLLDPADAGVDPQRVPPQDPYSVRCAPQVLGAGLDGLAWARRLVETEINAAVDNPLIFPDLPRGYKAVSGGNFHGAPVGYGADLMKVVLVDLASMSERRTFKLTDYRFDDPARAGLSLPRFLVEAGDGLEGLSSGLMIPQYVAAALVSAARTLAHPDSVDSIPSSANQEDHVSMSMNAGLHLRRIVTQVEAVLAIELVSAAQALDLRAGDGRPGAGVAAAHARLRQEVGHLTFDRFLAPDLERAVRLLRSGQVLAAARRAAGI
jgi:histidine ammonia-lyase